MFMTVLHLLIDSPVTPGSLHKMLPPIVLEEGSPLSKDLHND